MSSYKRIILPLVTSMLCLVLLVATLRERAVSGQTQQITIEAGESADVIVSLIDPPMRNFENREIALAALQTQIIKDAHISPDAIIHQYETFSLLALTVDAATLAALQENPNVVAIEPDLPLQPHLQDAVPNSGATYIHDTFGIKGTNVPVAIFDSGMQGDHSDFSISRTIGQQCFTDGDCLVEGSGYISDTGELAEDNNGHGTNVTGIIASNGTNTIPGFAPEATIIAVRVLDGNGSGRLSDLIAGLQWVIPSVNGFSLRLANMSLGALPSELDDAGSTTGLHNGSCDTVSAAMNTAITTLRGQSVILFASAGNNGSSTEIAFPACHSEVIAVGASYDSDIGVQPNSGTYSSTEGAGWGDCADNTTNETTVACFSNSNSQVQLIAPGAIITASGLMSSTSAYVGTSQASAAATGIAALLLQVDPTLTQAQLLHVMTSTATTVTDSKNNMTFPLVNARAAVESLLSKVYVPIVVVRP
ncbi:MAG: S8 family peptidase [Candidatus Promineifilaceae bacterium]